MTVNKITFDPKCNKLLRVITLGLKCTIHVINDLSNTSLMGRPQPSIKRRSHVFPVVASASARPSAKLPIKQWIFILTQISLIFTRKVLHLASLWKSEFLKLGNGLWTELCIVHLPCLLVLTGDPWYCAWRILFFRFSKVFWTNQSQNLNQIKYQVKLKESMFIKWEKPDLNQQVKHINLTLSL